MLNLIYVKMYKKVIRRKMDDLIFWDQECLFSTFWQYCQNWVAPTIVVFRFLESPEVHQDLKIMNDMKWSVIKRIECIRIVPWCTIPHLGLCQMPPRLSLLDLSIFREASSSRYQCYWFPLSFCHNLPLFMRKKREKGRIVKKS